MRGIQNSGRSLQTEGRAPPSPSPSANLVGSWRQLGRNTSAVRPRSALSLFCPNKQFHCSRVEHCPYHCTHRKRKVIYPDYFFVGIAPQVSCLTETGQHENCFRFANSSDGRGTLNPHRHVYSILSAKEDSPWRKKIAAGYSC